MIPKITRATANRIIREMDQEWKGGAEDLIEEIKIFHVHQNGRTLKRYRFHLKGGAILCSLTDWNKYNNNDPHSVLIKSLHILTDRQI
jgi:hypothetical protein